MRKAMIALLIISEILGIASKMNIWLIKDSNDANRHISLNLLTNIVCYAGVDGDCPHIREQCRDQFCGFLDNILSDGWFHSFLIGHSDPSDSLVGKMAQLNEFFVFQQSSENAANEFFKL